MAGSYSEDHLNKPLPPPLTASPAPMDFDARQPTLPFRQDTTSSAYSTRGNTLPVNSQYQPRQNTYSSSVHSQATAYAGAGAGAAGSYYADAPPYPSQPPSYTGQQHLGTQQPSHDASPLSATSASPFDTPFDDPASSSRHNLNGRGASADNMYGQNAIPLQDRNGKDPVDDMEDHVYEAAPKKREKKKQQGVRFGELGMFGAYGNRIPWVVYIFTAVQIGVFIGELVDNGKSDKSCSQPKRLSVIANKMLTRGSQR